MESPTMLNNVEAKHVNNGSNSGGLILNKFNMQQGIWRGWSGQHSVGSSVASGKEGQNMLYKLVAKGDSLLVTSVMATKAR